VEGEGGPELAVSVAGTAYTPAQPGLFIIQATMKGGVSASRGEEALDALIAEVLRAGVAPEELARAVRQLTVQLVDNVRTPYGLGQLLGTVQSIFGEPSRFTRDLAKYTQVTSEDVRRVVARYLIPQNRSVVTLIP
jgi:zinc protease